MLVPKRLENGYREFDDTAIERVKIIKLYLSLGLNTDAIVQIIECSNTTQNLPLCKAAYAVYIAKLDEVNRQIDILRDVQARLLERISEFNKLKQ
jgi:DNA-binding transcriptional MerR regulator